MKILAIETSGTGLSVAVSENRKIAAEYHLEAGFTNSEKLMPVIDMVFKKARCKIGQINKIAVCTGPGSFTGIRVGLSCAKTFAQNLDIPVTGVDTLDILAEGAKQKYKDYMIVPVIDALRDEVYAKNKGVVELENIGTFIEKLKKSKKKIAVAGNAVLKYNVLFKSLYKNIVFCENGLNYPKAGVLALMAENIKGEKYNKINPLYIRRSWAEEK